MSRWCILRCAGPSTLSLALTLAGDGLKVWTPIETIGSRNPRGKSRVGRQVPIMPTYLFAAVNRQDDVGDLLALSRNPIRRNRPAARSGEPVMHAGFSVFHYLDRIPLIDDAELEHLREVERRTVPRPPAPDLDPGDHVSLTSGAWAGMSGVVETSDGRFAFVNFGGPLRVKISTFILKPIEANMRSAGNGTAARAA